MITNRDLFDSTRLGLEIAAALQALYPGKIDFTLSRALIGSDEVVRRITAGDDPREIQQGMMDAMSDFLMRREKYLLYR